MAILSNTIVNGSFRCLNKMYIKDMDVTGTTAFSSLTATSLTTGTLTATGAASLASATLSGTLNLTNTTRTSGSSATDTPLMIGNINGARIEYDINGIQAKSSPTSYGSLYLNFGGGTVFLSTNGAVFADAGGIYSTDLYINNDANIGGDVRCETLRAKTYDQQLVFMNSGGLLHIGPTQFYPTVNTSAASLTVQKSDDVLTLTIIDPSITSTSMSGIVWTADSKVKVSGNINSVPTGTMDGRIASINASTHTLTVVVSGGNASEVRARTYEAIHYDHLSVMVYQRVDSGNYYPVGIELNCYDTANSSCTLRMSSGSSTTPTVMIGNLTNANLPTINNMTPTGYGLYSDNVFLRGSIVAAGGLIGDWTISLKGLYYNSDAPGSSSVTLIPSGTTAATTSIGGSSGSKQWVMTVKNVFGLDTSGNMFVNGGKIAGWTITNTALYNGTENVQDTTPGIYLGTDGIRNYYDANTYVNISGGIITAVGANITGNINAISGTIGGVNIVNGVLQVPSSIVVGRVSAGKNLARRTADCGTDQWALVRSTAVNGLLTMTPTSSSAYGKYKINYLDYKYYKDSTFTLSFDARYIVGSSSYSYGNLVAYIGVNDKDRVGNQFGSGADRYKSYSGIQITDTWARYSITCKIPDDLATGQTSALVDGNFVTFQFASSGSKWPIQIKNVMFENSNRGSDWEPAPEDVYTEGTTTIDGGKITTGSITANAISAGTITGDKISAGTITGDKIDAETITGDKIIAGTITADKLTVATCANIYANYDTFTNITDSTLYYNKDPHVTATIDSGTINNNVFVHNAYYGWSCAKLETDSLATDGYVYFGSAATNYGCVPVKSGQRYRISVYMRASEADTNTDLYIVGHTDISDANNWHSEQINTDIGTSWTRVETTYTAGSTYPYISIRVDLNTASRTLYVDAIQVEEVATDDQVASPFAPCSPTVVNGDSIIASEYQLYYGTGAISVMRLNNLNLTSNKMVLEVGGSFGYMKIDEQNGYLDLAAENGIRAYDSDIMAKNEWGDYRSLLRCARRVPTSATSITIEPDAAYLVIFWHDGTANSRGAYLVRNGIVLTLVAASAISFSGMSSSTSLSWSYTGNTPAVWVIRLTA